MAELPSGTVTFLFTDIEGSTARWEGQPEAMRVALARHDALLRAAIVEHGGHVVKTMGDAFHAAFSRAPDAVAAALDAQRRLAAESWGEIRPLRVRMALHSGVAEERDGDYYGPPLNRAARLLAIGHGGQVLLSEVVTGLVRDTLPVDVVLRDLGRHRLKDLTEPERVSQVVASDLASDFPPLASLDARPHNLPTHPTALLGRERQLAEVRKLIEGGARLVTLTGPGGTGKTRLGLQVAGDLLDAFEHGVFLVELAPISDPALVPSTIAQALGVRDIGNRPILDAVKERLQSRSVLLLLDNFDQVLPAASVVADLLAACPGLAVLATSREPLRLRGEHEYAVSPLSLPASGQGSTAEAVSRSPAVALFVQRARAIRADFALTDENASAVAEVCARLDGLPLAIELAAARVRLLPPEAMARRLERRLPLLVGGARDLPARQQTLRGAIDWSHDLLDEHERRLFRRLSVFVGGWTLEVAEAVCNADGDVDVLGGLDSLVSKSLARQDAEARSEPRFGMLETIREYALARLDESSEVVAVRRRFAAYYLRLAQAAEPKVRGVEEGQVRWLLQLERDHDNLRQIFSWGEADSVDPLIALRLAAALGWFWYIHGHVSEGRRLLEGALASGSGAPASVKGTALHRAANLALQQGDLAGAERLLHEGLRELRADGDPASVAFLLITLGDVHQARGDLDQVAALRAESIRLFREVGNAWGVGLGTHMLGQVLTRKGDLAAAAAAFNESLATRPTWDRGGLGITRHWLTRIALRRGDHHAARAHLREALALLREVGSLMGMTGCLETSARLALAEGATERAALLLGCALTLRQGLGTPGLPADRAELAELAAEARTALGEQPFADAWRAGQAMTLEQAVAYALDEQPST